LNGQVSDSAKTGGPSRTQADSVGDAKPLGLWKKTRWRTSRHEKSGLGQSLEEAVNDDLLTKIAQHGWSPELREEFVCDFDQTIGRSIVYFLARLRGLEGREIGQLLAFVERREGVATRAGDHPLGELIEEAYFAIYRQVFQGSLVRKYMLGKASGAIHSGFDAYLRGVVRHRVVDCLRRQDRRRCIQLADGWDEQIPESEPDWSRTIRAAWWDRVLRCQSSEAEERQELGRIALSLDGEGSERTRLCCAFAELKARSEGSERQNVRMVLAYYLSNYGTKASAAGRSIPSVEELTLERICGLSLSWDDVFRLFGRECNPSRVRQAVRQLYEELG
jgi:hypothetical protein